MASTTQTNKQGQRELAPVMIRPRQWMDATGMTVGPTYRHLYSGRLRGVQIGRSWFIFASELTEFFQREAEAA